MNIANIFNYLSIDVLPKRHLFQDEKRFNLLPKNDRQEIAPIAQGYLCQLPWSPKFSRTPRNLGSDESHLLQPAVLLARIYCIQSTVLLRKQIIQKIVSQMQDFPHSSLSVLSAFSETCMRFEPKILIAPAVWNAGSNHNPILALNQTESSNLLALAVLNDFVMPKWRRRTARNG